MALSIALKEREVDLSLLVVAALWGASYLSAKNWLMLAAAYTRAIHVTAIGALLIIGASYVGQKIESDHRLSKR